MGYRWFQSQGIKPMFPFGYGLSYTSFELSGYSVTPEQTDGKSPITVKVTVKNTMGVWDYYERDFVVRPGEYTVYVGTSSEDTPFEGKVTVE